SPRLIAGHSSGWLLAFAVLDSLRIIARLSARSVRWFTCSSFLHRTAVGIDKGQKPNIDPNEFRRFRAEGGRNRCKSGLDSGAATTRDRMFERVKIRFRLLGPRLTGRFVAR